MTKNTFTRGVILTAAVVALGAGACAGPEVPAQPTWERDIYPLLVARCIRCHDSPGHQDPLVTITGLNKVAIISFNYPTLAEVPPASQAFLAMISGAVRGTLATRRRMPPPPAEALEEWQIEMLDNWAKDRR